MKSTMPLLVVAAAASGGAIIGMALGILVATRKKRVSGDGLTSSTDDLSLFYSSDVAALTTIIAEMKKLPGDLYGKVSWLFSI